MASKDAPDIMNVKEIIEFAFGDFEKNAVNFKLVQTVLFLIARQLRLLERRVIVEMGPLTLLPSDTTLTVTEVKIHAAQKTQMKDGGRAGGAKPGAAGAKQGAARAKQGADGKRGVAGAKTEGGGGGAGTGAKRTKTTSSGDKTSTDITTSGEKTSTDRTTSGEKTSTDRATSGEKTSTDRTTSGEKTSTDITTSGEKTSTDRTTSGEKTSTDRATSGEKTSTDRTTSSGGKTSSDKTTSTSTEKPSSRTTSSDKITTSTPSSKDASGRQKPDSYLDILNTLEEQRERELRIIHQRTDSFEETTKTPTPMASVSSTQYEKLLVVKKVPSSEARLGETVHGHSRTPQISVVTQEQFQQMADAVQNLEKKLLPVGTPGFLENAELMGGLRKGASLTDAIAPLQLSARLETTEKTLACLISMVTELALQTPGVELDSETRALLEVSEKRQGDLGTSKASDHSEGDRSGKSRRGDKGSKGLTASPTETAFAKSATAGTEVAQVPRSMGATPEVAQSELLDNNFVTYGDLQGGSREMYDEMMKKVKTITTRISSTAEDAYRMAKRLEAKLESASIDNSRMVALENSVKEYVEQINTLDTGLSSQMTNYQEQLTQMQHDLEISLETMAEVLGNSGGDTEAMAELQSNFLNIQTDFENTAFQQKELKDAQDSTAYDLENLWREIEMLRDTKSDRDEVADALRDKAGINELNGLVSIQQFEAVRGDFQKRICTAYDKFNNQEYIWQKAIDDTVKVLNEKADLIQVYSLRDEVNKYLNGIDARMQIISDIVGEPKSSMVNKKVFRDTVCLSCGSPAHMDLEEPCKVPALPKFPSARQPAEGAEAESQTKEGGDYTPCYPNLPISHARDPRSHICKRYCGGSHTLVSDGLNRALPGLLVEQVPRATNREGKKKKKKKTKDDHVAPGTDGKLHLTDVQTIKKPCLPCNMPQIPPIAQPEPEPQKQAPVDSIDEFGNISLTPPAHEIFYN